MSELSIYDLPNEILCLISSFGNDPFDIKTTKSLLLLGLPVDRARLEAHKWWSKLSTDRKKTSLE